MSIRGVCISGSCTGRVLRSLESRNSVRETLGLVKLGKLAPARGAEAKLSATPAKDVRPARVRTTVGPAFDDGKIAIIEANAPLEKTSATLRDPAP